MIFCINFIVLNCIISYTKYYTLDDLKKTKILILIRENTLLCQKAGLFLEEDFNLGKITTWKVNESMSTISTSIKIVKIFINNSRSTKSDVPCLLFESFYFSFFAHNVWVKKTWTYRSSDTLLWFVQVFLTQTLLKLLAWWIL